MSSSLSRSSLSLALCFVALLVLSGCGKECISVTQNEGGIGLYDNATQDTLLAGENVVIPDTFPADIPRYPGAKVLLVTNDVQQNAHTVTQETTDDLPTAKTRIEAEMMAAGLSKTSEFADATVAILVYEKANTRFQFQIARDSQKNMTRILSVRVEVSPQP